MSTQSSPPSYLLALDGSKESLAAANVAWKLAQSQKAKLVALSVVDNQAVWDLLGSGLPGFIGSGPYLAAYETMQKALRTVSETILSAFAARSENIQLKTECLINQGDLLRQIFERSKEHDLVIMGRRRGQSSTAAQDLHSYIRTSLGKRLAGIVCCPLLLIPSEKPWSKSRLICSKDTFSVDALVRFLAITESLSLEREIYCTGPDTDVDELMQKVKNLVPHSVKIICSDGTEGDDSIAVAMDVNSAVLLVIPTMQTLEGRETSSGIQIQEFLSALPQLAVLILPPYSGEKQKEIEQKRPLAAIA